MIYDKTRSIGYFFRLLGSTGKYELFDTSLRGKIESGIKDTTIMELENLLRTSLYSTILINLGLSIDAEIYD